MKKREVSNNYRSVSQITDHVPSPATGEPFNSYDNKKLSQFDGDDFASFVLDRMAHDGSPTWDSTHFLHQIEYLDALPCLPLGYQRVYLYGIWSVVKPMVLTNTHHFPNLGGNTINA